MEITKAKEKVIQRFLNDSELIFKFDGTVLKNGKKLSRFYGGYWRKQVMKIINS